MESLKSFTSVLRFSTITTQIPKEEPFETVMTACPGATALTLPNSSIVATSGLLEVRVSSDAPKVLSLALSSNSSPGRSRAEVWERAIPSLESTWIA